MDRGSFLVFIGRHHIIITPLGTHPPFEYDQAVRRIIRSSRKERIPISEGSGDSGQFASDSLHSLHVTFLDSSYFNIEEREPAAATAEQSDSDGKLSRKMSCASVCSTDGEEDDRDDGDEEDDEKKAQLMLGPQLALKEHMEMDKDDESLRKWKEQLLAGVDLAHVGEKLDPEVKIQSLTIITLDRPDWFLQIPFVPNAKGYAFTLKDGSRYHLKFSFTVSNNIVSGLRYTNTVWKAGIRVENTKVMLGTFSPQKEPYTYELEEETTPSGIFARGSYSAKTKFVDDDGKIHLEMSYYFEIRKDWQ